MRDHGTASRVVVSLPSEGGQGGKILHREVRKGGMGRDAARLMALSRQEKDVGEQQRERILFLFLEKGRGESK